MGHASGMMGFPLRLLAREIHDRVVKAKGAGQVALVTGEEKIIPPGARYFLCTVESMPLDRAVEFLAVDEIQLCADPERGHIFTDRLLHARGGQETLFLGADTIRPLLSKLIPGIEFVTRPRLSQLTYAGPRKLARLPPKSAIVAFSAAEVYAMAEFVRRGRGGAAVVLGALSPRTRNAQVAMYQAGEVDYIVATDAIGMGLNMDVDHVAFAQLRKFDGQGPRALTAPEIAQIAGRAGRHMNDGTFGCTADQSGIPPEIVTQVEEHRFPALKGLFWRNPDLRFVSVEALLGSLDFRPSQAGLSRAREADDQRALTILAQDPDIRARAQGVERVRLLWDVCQIPDFRKVMADAHTRVLSRVFTFLTEPLGHLPTDWLAQQVSRLDRSDGEIDTLMGRIAAVRTWTYVSHRADWVPDATHWQGVTRAIEDKLSDALHERLTQRFVDRRTAVLVKRMRDAGPMRSHVDHSGQVRVEGQDLGRLSGFRFHSDQADGANAAKAVLSAAGRALKGEIASRVDRLAGDADSAFTLDDQGRILWRDEPVARLSGGPAPLAPLVEALASDLLDPAAREKVRRRCHDWSRAFLRLVFGPLANPDGLVASPSARGILHHLGQGLGTAPRRDVAASIRDLNEDDHRLFKRWSIRVGRREVYSVLLLKAPALRLRRLLWGLHTGRDLSMVEDGALDPQDCAALGFVKVAGMAIRTDALDRLLSRAEALAKQAPDGFSMVPALGQIIGRSSEDVGRVLTASGFVRAEDGLFSAAPAKAKPKRAARKPDADDGNPFAVLKRRKG